MLRLPLSHGWPARTQWTETLDSRNEGEHSRELCTCGGTRSRDVNRALWCSFHFKTFPVGNVPRAWSGESDWLLFYISHLCLLFTFPSYHLYFQWCWMVWLAQENVRSHFSLWTNSFSSCLYIRCFPTSNGNKLYFLPTSLLSSHKSLGQRTSS